MTPPHWNQESVVHPFVSTRSIFRLTTAVVVLALLVACEVRSPGETLEESPDGDEAGVDLSTDEAVARAFEAETGQALDDTGCVKRPASFSGIVVVGDFAYDYGCMQVGVFVDGEWVARPDTVTQRGLVAHGWATMDSDEREATAASWVEEVVYALGPTVVERSTKAFELEHTPTFEPVETTTDADGTTVVTLWLREPPGMIPEEAYGRYVYRLDGKASLHAELIDDFVVSIDELR